MIIFRQDTINGSISAQDKLDGSYLKKRRRRSAAKFREETSKKQESKLILQSCVYSMIMLQCKRYFAAQQCV